MIGLKETAISHSQIKCRHDLSVGKNLQDHIFGFIGPFLLNKPVSFVDSRDLSPLKAIMEYRENGTGKNLI